MVVSCAELMGAAHGSDSVEGGVRFWIQFLGEPGRGPAAPDRGRQAAPGLSAPGTCLSSMTIRRFCVGLAKPLQAWGTDVALRRVRVMEALPNLTGVSAQAILCDQRLRPGESGVDVLKVLLRPPRRHGAM